MLSRAFKLTNNSRFQQTAEKARVPTVGDNVYIERGAKLIGKIMIGNNAAIGANAVVTKDVGDGEAVGGVPARVIKYRNQTQEEAKKQ